MEDACAGFCAFLEEVGAFIESGGGVFEDLGGGGGGGFGGGFSGFDGSFHGHIEDLVDGGIEPCEGEPVGEVFGRIGQGAAEDETRPEESGVFWAEEGAV